MAEQDTLDGYQIKKTLVYKVDSFLKSEFVIVWFGILVPVS